MKPIFDQPSLAKIRDAQNPSEVVDAGHCDRLRLKIDRNDLRMPAGTEIAVRPGKDAEAGELVVAVVGGDHVLRRHPTDDGPVVGVVLGVVVEVPDA